eukprot:gene1008-579_t
MSTTNAVVSSAMAGTRRSATDGDLFANNVEASGDCGHVQHSPVIRSGSARFHDMGRPGPKNRKSVKMSMDGMKVLRSGDLEGDPYEYQKRKSKIGQTQHSPNSEGVFSNSSGSASPEPIRATPMSGVRKSLFGQNKEKDDEANPTSPRSEESIIDTTSPRANKKKLSTRKSRDDRRRSSEDLAKQMSSQLSATQDSGGGGLGSLNFRDGCLPIINPSKSKYIPLWDSVVLTALLWTCVFTPLEVAFIHKEFDLTDWNEIINIAIDVIFVCDMILQFCVMYPTATPFGTMWVSSRKKIFWHYVRGWFLIDFLSVFPINHIVTAAAGGYSDDAVVGRRLDGSLFNDTFAVLEDVSEPPNLRFIKVIRALRLLKLMRILKASRILKRWKSKIGFSQQKLTLLKYLVFLVVSTHWMGCLFGMVAHLEGDHESGFYSWIREQEEKEEYDWCNKGEAGERITFRPAEQWSVAVYWSMMTLTSIGYGDVVPVTTVERWVCIICMIFGGMMWAYIIGGATAIMSYLQERSLSFNRQIDDLNSVLSEKGIPHEHRTALRLFFQYAEGVRDTEQYQSIMTRLSPHLQEQMCSAVHSDIFHRLTHFPDVTLEFKVQVTLRMNCSIYAKSERFGKIWCLYVLQRGLVLRASDELLSVVATFTADELMSFNQFVFYTVLTAMATQGRHTLRTKVIDSPEI